MIARGRVSREDALQAEGEEGMSKLDVPFVGFWFLSLVFFLVGCVVCQGWSNTYTKKKHAHAN